MHANVSKWLAMIEADGRPEVIEAAQVQLEVKQALLEEWAASPGIRPNPLGEGVDAFDLIEAAHELQRMREKAPDR